MTLKLVVEPGGSVGLAALLAGKVELEVRRQHRRGLVLSGGNVDPDLFARIIRCKILVALGSGASSAR